MRHTTGYCTLCVDTTMDAIITPVMYTSSPILQKSYYLFNIAVLDQQLDFWHTVLQFLQHIIIATDTATGASFRIDLSKDCRLPIVFLNQPLCNLLRTRRIKWNIFSPQWTGNYILLNPLLSDTTS